MSKFRFEALLKLREAERDEKKHAFLEAESSRQLAQKQLETLEQELIHCQEESRRARESSTINPIELKRFQAVRSQLSDERQRAQEHLKRMAEESETKRSELNSAIKDVKILQALKDKTEERELEEERRKSEKNMDELATHQKALERRKEQL